MTVDQKKALFDHYRRSLAAAGLATVSDDSLVCPLCWQETQYDDLTLEHIVPGSVGGKQKILTCWRCNNEQGSTLDSHLSQFQNIRDQFVGYGTISAKIAAHGHRVTANIEWGNGFKKISIVERASNPAEVLALQEHFKSGNIGEFNLSLSFLFSKNRFHTAVLRAAYLVLFKCFGYEYAVHDVVQTVRRRVCDPTLEHPRIGSLILELRSFEPCYDEQHLVVPGDVNGVPFFLVIIRVRKATTTYLAAYLPVPGRRSDGFFQLMEQCSREHNGETLTIPTQGIFT